MVAYWLLYDVLKEEGLLEQYGFDSLGDDIPDLSGLEFKSPYDYPSYSEMMDMNITIDDLETCKYNEKETLAEAEKYIVHRTIRYESLELLCSEQISLS